MIRLARKILLNQRADQALNLSLRTRECLDRAGIITIGELLVKSTGGLMEIKGFGKKSLDELRTELSRLGLSLNEEH